MSNFHVYEDEFWVCDSCGSVCDPEMVPLEVSALYRDGQKIADSSSHIDIAVSPCCQAGIHCETDNGQIRARLSTQYTDQDLTLPDDY